MATSSTINLSSTSLHGHTGAPTPSTFTDSMGPSATIAAILEAGQTTITAYRVLSTTDLAVVDGTTLTQGRDGITLGNGDVVSLGANGLEDETTTAFYEAVTVSQNHSGTISSSGTTVVVTKSSTTLTSTKTTGGTPTTNGATGTASAASTSNSGIAPTVGAGKALALFGALGGMMAYGL